MRRNYDFYLKRDSQQNATLVGEALTFSNDESTYVVVDWSEECSCMNYNRKVGLIRIGGIVSSCGKNYFNVGVFSVDDWDYGFSVEDLGRREEIIEWLKSYCKSHPNADHEDMFWYLRNEFTITSTIY